MRARSALIIASLLWMMIPARTGVAAESHRILSRAEWGADESLRIDGAEPTSHETVGDNGDVQNRTTESTPSEREKDCVNAHKNYPEEFKTKTIVTSNAQGQRLRWPQEYSPEVRLLVVHHTAIAVTGDTRSGREKMRALYQFHSQNRGWGDVGYHYVIDDQGQIYEGRAGGEYVVGGHVYCNNVGTVGIAMMGNFDREPPTQAQAKSLQWLLKTLADKYQLNTSRNTIFHGKTLPVIVGHRQLVSTDCPGYAMWEALDQVRANVRTGNTDAAVTFPVMTPEPAATPSSEPAIVTGKDGLAPLGETLIEGRPGAEISIPVFFRAAKKSYPKNTRIARITRTPGLTVWLDHDGKLIPARDLRTPGFLKQGESTVIRLRVRLPMERGRAALKVGLLNYTFELAGRAARGRQIINGPGSMMLPENGTPVQQTRVTPSRVEDPRWSSPSSPSQPSSSSRIRIRLTPELSMKGLTCGDPSVKFTSVNGLTRIEGYFRSARQYRGKIECKVIDGELALINELPIEEYMAGLGEEPDSEPFEKQRAFAIAARTYVTYYADPAHRKFPGMPYDGDDSGARFQVYRGHDFEGKNPEWLRAVRETANKVLTYRGEVIRAPYFSTDDGKTRTTAEAGWPDFPFAEIFTSKDDPWCVGMKLAGHGVGMSGCGAGGQARSGKTAEQILSYYYPGTVIQAK